MLIWFERSNTYTEYSVVNDMLVNIHEVFNSGELFRNAINWWEMTLMALTDGECYAITENNINFSFNIFILQLYLFRPTVLT